MQLAVAALGSIFGGGAAVGGAAAAAGGISAMTILQGVATIAGVIGTIGAANASAAASEQQAIQATLQAGQEKVSGTERQTRLKEELARVLGENEVTFANAGIDISAGIAQTNATSQKQKTASELSLDLRDQEFRSALHRLRASGLRARAKSQRTAGLIGAIGDFAEFGIDLRARG